MSDTPVDPALSKWLETLDEGEEHYLYCQQCAAAITRENARQEINGQHRHRFINPAAVVYEVCCFASAPGVDISGEATREHSWFPAHSWQYAHCIDCASHLGWYFERDGQQAFFALIDARITSH